MTYRKGTRVLWSSRIDGRVYEGTVVSALGDQYLVETTERDGGRGTRFFRHPSELRAA